MNTDELLEKIRAIMKEETVYGGPKSQDHFPTKIRQNSTVQESTH